MHALAFVLPSSIIKALSFGLSQSCSLKAFLALYSMTAAKQPGQRLPPRCFMSIPAFILHLTHFILIVPFKIFIKICATTLEYYKNRKL